MPEELWTEVPDIVQEAVIKIIPKKKKCKKAKWLSEEALQIAEKREVKGKGEKERYTHLSAEFQQIARKGKKALLSDQYKKNREKNRMVKSICYMYCKYFFSLNSFSLSLFFFGNRFYFSLRVSF